MKNLNLKSILKSIASGACLFASVAVFAQTKAEPQYIPNESAQRPVQRESLKEKAQEWTNRHVARDMAQSQSTSGWMPAISLGAGSFEQNGNTDQDGGGFALKVLGTMYLADSNWLGDAGIGVQQMDFKDRGNDPMVGVLGISARYVFADNWSVGPTADLYLGNGEDFGSTNDNFTGFFGAQLVRSFPIENDQLIRVGAKAAGELGEGGQSSTNLALVFEWGFGANNSLVRRVSSN